MRVSNFGALVILGSVASLLFSITANAALFPPGGPVRDLDAKDFDKTLQDGAAAMVSFTAPWCKYCRDLTPEFTQAAQSLAPLIPFYNIDCDAEENRPICGRYGVKGFPTIKAFPKGSKSPPRDYQGERKARELISYASNLVPVEKVKKLKSTGEIESKFLPEKSNLPHALLLHPSNPSVPLMWRVLASRLDGKYSFGFIKDADGKARKELGADEGEGVKVVTWSADGQKEVYSDGALKFEPLLAYFLKRIGGDAPHVKPASSTTSRSTTTSSSSSAPAETLDAAGRAALKRKEMEERWAEEERRDRLRREKRERDRLEREFADQDRLSHDEMKEEERSYKEDPIEVDVHLPPHPSNVKEAAQANQRAVDSEDSDVEDLLAEFDTPLEKKKTPPTPLEADSQEFDHGKTQIDRESSASTPLEEQADAFEHGQHTKDGEEIKDGHVRDEL